MDRTLLEAINAPLTHLVRNAIDHGIETPDSRVERESLLRAWCGSGHRMKEGRS